MTIRKQSEASIQHPEILEVKYRGTAVDLMLLVQLQTEYQNG